MDLAQAHHEKLMADPERYIALLRKQNVIHCIWHLELQHEVARLRTALEKVKEEGKVCDNFELCTHRACQSSYTAWAIADEALSKESE